MSEQPPRASELPETILVVEDADTIRELVATVLRSMNFIVLEAATASEALSMAEGATAPDLLLSDIQLPGMSGLELAHVLTELFPQLPVILMTAFTLESSAATSIWPILQKPFTAKQLIDAIQGVLHPEMSTD